MRKLWISLLSLACAATSIFALTGCGSNDKKTSLCTHTWEEEITKTPLCTVKGEATKTCTLCGEIETIEISSIGHKFQEHEAKAATCTDIGWTAYVECTREGCDYNNYQELPALEHLSQTHEAKAATCTEIGWNAYETCSRANCGYTTYEEIPALNHDEIPHDAQEATCTEIGWNAYVTCNRDGCGYTTYEEIPAKGHNFVDKVCDSCGTPYFSDGLSYRLNADEESYTLTGLGACRDLDVVIPATYNDLPVTSIQRSAFYNQFSLTSVTIGSNVVTIDDNAFEACSGLTSVTIPDTTVTIGSLAFYNCSSLKEITLGNGVTTIGAGAFTSCGKLTSIRIPNSVTDIGEFAFQGCSDLTSVTLGNQIKTIGEHAFDGCESLTGITIPDSVTSIGAYAFYKCLGLKTATVGDGVTAIGEYAFYRCRKLIRLVVGKSVISIGDAAFYECYYLVEVINNSSLQIEKGSNANGAVGLYALEIYDSENPFTETKLSIDNGYLVYTNGEEKILVRYEGTETDLVLPSYITAINQYAFLNQSITSVVIPEGVTTIGTKAFHNCHLTSIVIPQSLTSIDESAFGEYTYLDCVYYKGTTDSWEAINCNSFTNHNLYKAPRYYYSENEPTDDGNYWHYGENGKPAVWEKKS